MPKLAPIEILCAREYLRVSECAAVFGRGSQFWAEAFDRRMVAGYRHGKSKRDGQVVGVRYIEAASARAYLRTIGTQQRVSHENGRESVGARLTREWRERRAQQGPSPGT